MRGTSWFRLAFLAVIVAGSLAIGVPGQEKRSLAEFMREKLDHTRRILDGLVREDYPQITRGARALKAMRQSPEWPKMSRPAAGRYALYSLEFQAASDELVVKAGERDIDGVTLAYVRLTKNCVNCHKELRNGPR